MSKTLGLAGRDGAPGEAPESAWGFSLVAGAAFRAQSGTFSRAGATSQGFRFVSPGVVAERFESPVSFSAVLLSRFQSVTTTRRPNGPGVLRFWNGRRCPQDLRNSVPSLWVRQAQRLGMADHFAAGLPALAAHFSPSLATIKTASGATKPWFASRHCCMTLATARSRTRARCSLSAMKRTVTSTNNIRQRSFVVILQT
jgi:hypothetical protein